MGRETGKIERKQHILVISQYFYPEEFRINDICREWVKRGHEVTVVTGIPNYPQGKFYRGYSWFHRRKEEYKGIHVIRIPLIPRGQNAVMLALNYFSFVIFGFFWKLFTKERADKVFIFEVSPMTQALVGVWFAKRRKIPCYIYVQDLWPENVETVTGIHNRQIIGAIDRMVDYIYRNCTKIFTTSPGFVKRIEERESAYEYADDSHIEKGTAGGRSKVVYWPQYAEDFYRPVEKKTLPDVEDDDCLKIAFTGNIGYTQGLEILPRIAGLLKDILSELGLVVLSPIFLIFIVAIVVDDPGSVFFTQKRVGRNKRFFRLHKFRSMKMSTPHDIPIHMLENPEQYITKIGKFMRRISIDVLPQFWDIFVGNMSAIGPRPALWNQDVLVAER